MRNLALVETNGSPYKKTAKNTSQAALEIIA
jgi:hypothetical protein